MSEHAARLEELRAELRAERISWGELAELESLAEHIQPGDVELLEAAGVPEYPPEIDDDFLTPAARRVLDALATTNEFLEWSPKHSDGSTFVVIYTDETAARVTVEETPDPGPDEREGHS